MRNVWISVTLDPDLRDKLYKIGVGINEKVNFSFMDYNDLHMTALFLGEKCKKRDIIENILQRFADEFKEMQNEKIKFTKASFFPPTKNNLIVLEYECTKNFKNKLETLKKEFTTEFGVVFEDREYVPHITLGKLNLTKKQLSELINSDFLNKLNDKLCNNKLDILVSSEEPLYICGNI